jgi:predicted GNAT family N-acyltransferase
MSQVFHPVQFKGMYQGQYGTARVSPEGYVSNLRVREEQRGRGHGSSIMKQVTDDADKLGHGLTLHARPELHGFYAKHGFVRTGDDYIGGVPHPRLERKPKSIEGI